MPITEASGIVSGSGATLEKPYYFKIDPLDKKMTLRGKVNGIDKMVTKFGSLETDIFKSNVIMGGYRQIKPDGEELFLIRQSTAGDKRAVSVGNMDTNTANSLVSGPAGWRESRMRTDLPITQAITFTGSLNPLGGVRLTAIVTSSVAASWREFELNVTSGAGVVKFNTRIEDPVTNELLSIHQDKAEFEAGFGEDKFKRTLVIGINTLPLPLPHPVPAGNQFRLVFDFEKTVGLTFNATLKGFALVLGRVPTITQLTISERNALPAAEKWESRIFKLTNGSKDLCVFPADNVNPTPIGVPVGTIINGIWGLASMGNLATPEGYWPLDGTVINAPWSVLHGKTTPDTRNRVLANASSTNALGAFAGVDLYSLLRSELPNFTLTGTTGTKNIDHNHSVGTLATGNESAGHTHDKGTLVTSNAGIHTHPNSTPSSVTSFQSGSSTYVYNQGTTSSGSAGDHAHPITGSTGDRSANHTHPITGSTGAMVGTATHDHTYTTPSINGGVSQTQVNMRQATYYVTQLIKL